MDHAIANNLLNPPKGENHPFAKLTDKQVKQIRRIYKKGATSQYELAARFGVQQPRISSLVNNKARKLVRL